MNSKELGKRLREARERCGLSQQSAADALDLSRTSITQIEGGNRSVSTHELTKLAKLYHHDVSHFFEDILENNEEMEVLLSRAAPGLCESPKIKQQINHYIDLCREGITLEKIMEYEPRIGPPAYSLPIPRHKGEAAAQGEGIADQERRRLGVGIESIGDIVDLIANQGIWVSGASLPEGMSGLFLNHSKTGFIILVNANHVKSRKRFSYAHEYAHALFDRNDNVRISSTENHTEIVEVRANAFAAAFLMPAEGVSKILNSLNKGKPSRYNQVIFDVATGGKSSGENRVVPYSQHITFQDAAIVAHHFGVSYQAAVYRMRTLNFITQKECDEFIEREQFGKSYLRTLNLLDDLEEKEDKQLWDREFRQQMVYLVIEAYRREEISRGRVIELGDEIGVGGKILFELAQANIQ